MKKHMLLLAVSLGLTSTATQASLVFEENFGSLADGTIITLSNTSFTYVRLSTGTGTKVIEAVNPANVGTGSSGYLVAPTTSLTGVGVQSTLSPSNVYTFAVDFRFTNVTAGDIVFGVGTGTSFTGNGTFTGADGLFWLQSDSGNFERRQGSSWVDMGPTTFANNTNYSLHVVANGSGGALNYGTSDSVAAGTMDVWLNGSLLADNVAVTNSLSANGFRIYSVSGTGVEIDNVKLWNAATAIPEPSVAAMLLLGFGLVLRGLRRKN